jgi:hypothetical protein
MQFYIFCRGNKTKPLHFFGLAEKCSGLFCYIFEREFVAIISTKAGTIAFQFTNET